MKKRYDIVQAALLVIILVAAGVIGNGIVKGVLLFLFASALIANTALGLWAKRTGRIREQVVYWVLLPLEIVLAVAAISVILA